MKKYPLSFISWFFYNKRMLQSGYPEDAIRPQHNAILVSLDKGESWKFLSVIKTTSKGPNGFWITGSFFKGNCLTGFVDESLKFSHPYLITENVEGINENPFSNLRKI